MTTSFSVRVPRARIRLSVGVTVYERKADFAAHVGPRGRHMLAACFWDAPLKGRHLASIHVPRGNISYPLLTHECFHVVCRYMERLGVMAIPVVGQTNLETGDDDGPEEHTAIVLDGLVGAIHRQLLRRKLYP